MSNITNPGPSISSHNIVQGNIGNIQQVIAMTAALTPVAVATITSAEQTFTVTGLLTTDIVEVMAPGLTAGAALTGARVSAANTLALTFDNPTVASVTPLAGNYTILVFRPLANAIADGLPTSLPVV